jgi:monooxygenase
MPIPPVTSEPLGAGGRPAEPTAPEHVDVLIVGAGLSGIGAACHLRRSAPARPTRSWSPAGAIGGTWDLFRYPGVRSDSDMFTLGYPFRPWTGPKSIADGASIRATSRTPPASTASDRSASTTGSCRPSGRPRTRAGR